MIMRAIRLIYSCWKMTGLYPRIREGYMPKLYGMHLMTLVIFAMS